MRFCIRSISPLAIGLLAAIAPLSSCARSGSHGQGTPGPMNGSPAAAAPSSACLPGQLSLSTAGPHDGLDGMSHSGVYLTLRNTGSSACQVPGLPEVSFAGPQGPLQTTQQVAGARFMHPGPVVLPLTLQPGSAIRASVRWVSGSVFADSVCIDPTTLTLRLPEGPVAAPVSGHLCGDRAQGVQVEVTRFLPPNSGGSAQ